MSWSKPQFGSRLTRALNEKGWTQRALAAHMAVAPATISGWITLPTNNPSMEEISRIAEALDVSAAWLTFGDDYPMTTSERRAVDTLRAIPDAQRTCVAAFLQALANSFGFPDTSAAPATASGLRKSVTTGWLAFGTVDSQATNAKPQTASESPAPYEKRKGK